MGFVPNLDAVHLASEGISARRLKLLVEFDDGTKGT